VHALTWTNSTIGGHYYGSREVSGAAHDPLPPTHDHQPPKPKRPTTAKVHLVEKKGQKITRRRHTPKVSTASGVHTMCGVGSGTSPEATRPAHRGPKKKKWNGNTTEEVVGVAIAPFKNNKTKKARQLEQA